MTDDVKTSVDEIIKLHAKTIKDIGPTADKTTTLIDNMSKLYRLRQKDDDTEMKHDEFKDKLAYDNGRADLELRAQEHSIRTDAEKLELERVRLDFDREKFQCELAVKEGANRLEEQKLRQNKVGIVLSAAAKVTGVMFDGWVTRSIMKFEQSGVVSSFIGRNVFGSMLKKTKMEM